MRARIKPAQLSYLLAQHFGIAQDSQLGFLGLHDGLQAAERAFDRLLELAIYLQQLLQPRAGFGIGRCADSKRFTARQQRLRQIAKLIDIATEGQRHFGIRHVARNQRVGALAEPLRQRD